MLAYRILTRIAFLATVFKVFKGEGVFFLFLLSADSCVDVYCSNPLIILRTKQRIETLQSKRLSGCTNLRPLALSLSLSLSLSISISISLFIDIYIYIYLTLYFHWFNFLSLPSSVLDLTIQFTLMLKRNPSLQPPHRDKGDRVR